MRRSELNKWLTPEDKMMVAVKHEVTDSYIRHLLRDSCKWRSETATNALADLEKLAAENVLWMGHKKQLIAA